MSKIFQKIKFILKISIHFNIFIFVYNLYLWAKYIWKYLYFKLNEFKLKLLFWSSLWKYSCNCKDTNYISVPNKLINIPKYFTNNVCFKLLYTVPSCYLYVFTVNKLFYFYIIINWSLSKKNKNFSSIWHMDYVIRYSKITYTCLFL